MTDGGTKIVGLGLMLASIASIIFLVDKGHQVSNEVPPLDQPVNAQAAAQTEPTSPPMFEVKYQTSVGEGFGGGIVTWRTYSLLNTSEQSERIKWITINNREECRAVPVWNSYERTIRAMEVLSDNSDHEIAEFLRLEVGQAVPIKMPDNCGEPVRLKVATDRGEYDIGPLTFY